MERCARPWLRVAVLTSLMSMAEPAPLQVAATSRDTLVPAARGAAGLDALSAPGTAGNAGNVE